MELHGDIAGHGPNSDVYVATGLRYKLFYFPSKSLMAITSLYQRRGSATNPRSIIFLCHMKKGMILSLAAVWLWVFFRTEGNVAKHAKATGSKVEPAHPQENLLDFRVVSGNTLQFAGFTNLNQDFWCHTKALQFLDFVCLLVGS